MVRNFKRKTDRGTTPVQEPERAANDVKNQGKSIRSVAKEYSVCHVTLYRFYKAKQKLEDKGSNELPPVGYRSATQVFMELQKKELTKYLLMSADAYYGLSPKDVREFAYELAVKYKCSHPKSWEENGKAGADWFTGYITRNATLSIRSAEATSLSRATSFNKHNVGVFLRQTPSTSAACEPHSNFSPEELRPLPKAPPRQIVGSKRKKMQAEILTDMLVKKAIEEAERQKPTKAKRKIILPKKLTKRKQNKSKHPKKKRATITDSSDDEENYCLVCTEHFQNFQSKEVWIQCVICHLWAHKACIPDINYSYLCHNCDSDDEN